MSSVPGASAEARLLQAASLPETLAAGFDTFEAIRRAARNCQDRVPALFAAFMTAADAAVDGREALTIAPSLPLADRAWLRDEVAACTDAGPAAATLAALAVMLRDQLYRAAAVAEEPGDRAACHDAAAAAERICQLMTRDDDDGRLR
jgi:hypothetical protein